MSHQQIRTELNRLKEQSGFSLRQIAEKCDAELSPAAISLYLRGGKIKDSNLDALLRVFGYELHHKKVVKKK